MAAGYVVLRAGTPPDSSKVAALFITSAEQGDATCKARAEAFRDANFPTSVVQAATVDSYATGVVITTA